jgi:hypothetical protein
VAKGYTNLLHSKDAQIWIFGFKIYHLATLLFGDKDAKVWQSCANRFTDDEILSLKLFSAHSNVDCGLRTCKHV